MPLRILVVIAMVVPFAVVVVARFDIVERQFRRLGTVTLCSPMACDVRAFQGKKNLDIHSDEPSGQSHSSPFEILSLIFSNSGALPRFGNDQASAPITMGAR